MAVRAKENTAGKHLMSDRRKIWRNLRGETRTLIRAASAHLQLTSHQPSCKIPAGLDSRLGFLHPHACKSNRPCFPPKKYNLRWVSDWRGFYTRPPMTRLVTVVFAGRPSIGPQRSQFNPPKTCEGKASQASICKVMWVVLSMRQ